MLYGSASVFSDKNWSTVTFRPLKTKHVRSFIAIGIPHPYSYHDKSNTNSHLTSLEALLFLLARVPFACLHLHYITRACLSFLSRCCCSLFSPVEPIWSQHGIMKTSSRFVHQAGAANMDQRYGSRSGLQPNLHHAAHLACSYRALVRILSFIIQFLVPTK